MKYAALTLCCVALMATSALADDKFASMDANKDGTVSAEEFKAAYPQMNDAAFSSIDVDKNKQISHDEWDMFLARHQQGKMGSGMGGIGGGMPPHPQDTPAKPMITPPPSK